jgi:two-component system, LytTR family, sensor kinase
VGVLGGLLRDVAPSPDEIWSFSPWLELNIWRIFRNPAGRVRTLYHWLFLGTILVAEVLRSSAGFVFGDRLIFTLHPFDSANPIAMAVAVGFSTLFAVSIPMKVWNNARNEMKLEAQQRLLTEARLEALRSQINPHFLFNTLNSVASLIRTNPDQARTMVYKLSNILRRLLRRHENLNPLREELSFIGDYLAVEMVRFGPKLRFVNEVAPETLNWLVPSMLLQPLVENCIKHGLSSKVEGGTIRIHSSVSDGKLHLSVEDDGIGIPEAKMANLFDQGIGVGNVNQRLKLFFGNEYRFLIDSKPGEGTRMQIEIPELQQAPGATS